MSNQEKRHRTTMQHLRYLDSFMNEIDREVMSLTDRAFKSLCIGDEAIYNDSEFSPSPVSCHKPVVEDVSKKTQESSFSAVKKLNSHPLNGANDLLTGSSKDSALFAVFSAKKNGESTKMTNGDSWDKSALLSIQRELSEFSSDYQRLAAEHLSQAKNHLKSDEKVSAKKSSKDASLPSGKSNKLSKNNKLRQLNSINFFLHSEFSPFLSWRDFNRFPIGQEHISEIIVSDRPPEWYDLPLYKELTAAHGHFKLSFPPSEEKEVEKCPIQSETRLLEPQVASVQSSVAPKPEKESKHNIPTKDPPLASEQRCNSERAEPCVPWRKSRSRAKSAAPVGHSINSVCERTRTGERSAQVFKNEVKTIEDQTSASSTPFSISQLLTPVIPSRYGTGTSDMLSPTAFEVPLLPEREVHPSPEIRREGYKSIASSLLFNLKDNRKRVKTMYSPPKFKGLDVGNQSKESPQPKDGFEIQLETISPASQKAIISQMSPLLETADTQTCSPANGGMPDDYLAFSLLQSGTLKSNRSPGANKATYPSLQLYRKTTPEEINSRANAQTVVETSSQVFTDKASKDHGTEHSYPSKELQSKNNPLESTRNAPKPTVERSLENKSGKSPSVRLPNLEQQVFSDGTNQMKTREQKSPVKEKEPPRKETGAKHVFSARQNNYIKSQRFVSTDDDNHNDSNAEKGTIRDSKWSRHSKNTKTKEKRQEEHIANIHKDKVMDGPLLKEGGQVRGEANTAKELIMTSKSGLETQREQKGNSEKIKRNIKLFASMEQAPNKTNAPLKRENVVIDKYDLAKMALEEVIAEREQRKLKSKAQGGELPTSGEDQQSSVIREKSAKDGKGQNTVSAFKTNWQTGQTRSEDMAKHGESHVAEVKLARPCTQEASIGQSQQAGLIKHNERDKLCLDNQESNTDNTSKDGQLCQKIELECTKAGDHLSSSVGQCEEELAVSSFKPEIPPRRGRSNSHNNDRVGEKTVSHSDFKKEGDTTVKTKDKESREVDKVQSSQSKNRGPKRGNVLSLKEKYDKESKVNLKDAQKGTPVEDTKSMEEGPNEKAPTDKMKHKFIPPKLTVSDPESGTYSIIYKEMDSESERKSKDVTQEATHDLTNNITEEMEDNKVQTNEKEEASEGQKQNKSKGPSKSYVKDFFSGFLFGLSSSEKGKPVDEHEDLSETLSSESFKTDKARKDSITVYDILGQSHTISSLNGKQTHHSSRSSNSNSSELSPFHESELGAKPQPEEFLSKADMKERVDGKVKPTIDSCSLSNPESESDVSPPNDVDKGGWVHNLIESARSLTQISPNHTQLKIDQQLPLKSHLNEEGLDLCKDCVHSPVGSVKSPTTNPPAMHLLSLPVTVKVGSGSVSEEEEQRSAVSTLSEGLESYETCGGDAMEEKIAPVEDEEGSKAPSERSASVCSGNDSNGQSKPPVVPPKTEKALRRAMKLTTRRIQKAEAKSKPERKSRSSDKSVSHKTERRHHSTDKLLDRSENRSLSSDGKHSEHLNEPKTQRSEKPARHHSGLKSQNIEETEPSKKLQHASKDKERQTSTEKQQDGTANHGDHLGNGISNDCDRLGRSNEKRLPKKLERRTQSLDRFLREKHQNMSSRTGGEVKSNFLIEGSQYSTPKTCIEQTYAPTTNLVTQSFPITQRKLLQDPDSGQYFLVDIPVQVKTKTFFDPETKSYVQLPVQSPEASPMEVMNTPPLMLYHGFVPVPVPSQKSRRSMNPPDDLEDFESSRKQMQEDFYQINKEEGNPYIEPVYISQEHTPEEEIDSVR
ncbi:uncharacterized protein LOC120466683 [Pimephales promelas]|uniref:uncharacterized protein LOC120466683 n=1 Tax=Pimephales promelas TaxID=90988 RepID=UPI001955E8E4|nr:uncharacterized protein LOC120466683 [Pimephales promelas]XP_039511197.1 uncharacterized protein LOC120466683 [Pimephales promelas]